jgi:hypothetical protein
MQERYEKLQLNPNSFLWPEEEKLAHHLVKEQEECLSWIEEEKGEFRQDFFPPVCIPTVPHTPWVYKNIPIPPRLHDELVKIICDKIVSGAYEPSNAAHRSRWFCVIKWDGSSVHNLCPFNTITIGDASVPPIMEQLVELFGARACYASLNLFIAYDQRVVHPELRDATTFQFPLSALHHTRLVMGHTNSVQIMQGDINNILKDEIPLFTVPFIDDVTVKGPVTCYENADGTYETIVILGQQCNYEGHVPHEAKTQKIQDWPIPIDITSVCSFLGTCGFVWIFIKELSMPVSLLT